MPDLFRILNFIHIRMTNDFRIWYLNLFSVCFPSHSRICHLNLFLEFGVSVSLVYVYPVILEYCINLSDVCFSVILEFAISTSSICCQLFKSLLIFLDLPYGKALLMWVLFDVLRVWRSAMLSSVSSRRSWRVAWSFRFCVWTTTRLGPFTTSK